MRARPYTPYLSEHAELPFQALFDANPAAIIIFSHAGLIEAANRAAATMLGVAPTALQGRHLITLLPGLPVKATGDLDLEAMTLPRAFSVALLTANKSELPIQAAFCHLPAAMSRCLAGYLTFSSITKEELTRAEASETRMKFALESAGIGDWSLDLRTNHAIRSPQHDACFGYKTPVQQWSYETFLSHVDPIDQPRVKLCYERAFAGQGTYDIEFRVVWPDQTRHWLWSKGRFYFDADGKPLRAAGIQVDITERKLAEEMQRLSSSALQSTGQGVTIADARLPNQPLIFVNAAFEKMTGYSAAEVLGKNCRFCQGDDRRQPALEPLRAALVAGREATVILRNYRKDGGLFWNELKVSPIFDDEGCLTHFVGIQSDITERIEAQKQLAYLASHDPLTGLPNRRAFEDYLARLQLRCKTELMPMAVVFVDIDRFKIVNDSFGHGAGDKLLQILAERLLTCVGADEAVARVGGDEFLVTLTGINDPCIISDKVQQILNTVADAINLDGQEFNATASAGIALFPEDSESATQLIKYSDAAMLRAKQEGRGTFQFFRADMVGDSGAYLSTAYDLRLALERDEFLLHYQPKFSAADGRLTGYEALIRWRHPKYGLVPPGKFIQVAEDCGLIVPIGEWVIHEACRQNRRWRDAGLTVMPVAVNVSIAQFRRKDLMTIIRTALEETRLEPAFLEIELTESLVMDNAELFIAKMAELKEMGVSIAIDDFGTGYSSLSYLKRFSIDTLKIDRSFVNDKETGEPDFAICKAVIMLAHGRGLRVVAEGVEKASQSEFLSEVGCDELQGFHLCRPSEADALVPLLSSGKLASAGVSRAGQY